MRLIEQSRLRLPFKRRDARTSTPAMIVGALLILWAWSIYALLDRLLM